MTRFVVMQVAVFAAGLVRMATASPASAVDLQPMSDGVRAADAAIEQCLKAKPAGGCRDVAFSRCESGSSSQSELNACTAYSRAAWERRLAEVEARLMDLARGKDPPMYVPPGTGIAARLETSLRLWHHWNEQDCALQALTSTGGSLHALELGLCFSNHAADRVHELSKLEELWVR